MLATAMHPIACSLLNHLLPASLLCNQEIAEPLPCTSEVTREALLAMGARCSHEITKLGLALLNSPSLDTVSPVAENCLSFLTILSCSLRSLLPLAGATMRQQVVSTGRAMIDNLRTLIGELMNKGIQALRCGCIEGSCLSSRCSTIPQRALLVFIIPAQRRSAASPCEAHRTDLGRVRGTQNHAIAKSRGGRQAHDELHVVTARRGK